MKRVFLTSTVIVLVATVLAIALPLAPRSSHAETLPATSGPDKSAPEGVAPEQLTINNAHPGIYFIDAGYIDMDPAVFPVSGAIRFYGWSALNPANGNYNWSDLDNYIARRKGQGLETGIMLTTYDGMTSGDIRSTPNYVIKKANSVIPAYDESSVPSYASYWRKAGYNADFEWTPNTWGWTLAGNVSVVPEPKGVTGDAARLGGVDNATGSISHSAERIPAMPPSLDGTLTAYVDASVYIETTDSNPNDHLYIELWNSSNTQIGSLQLDINNLSHPANTWQSYRFDISSIAHEQSPRVTFRVANDGVNPTTFYVDNVGLFVRHLIPNYESADYLDPYKTFIQALGDRYKTNADLEFIAIGTGLFGENQPTQDNFNHVPFNAGLTSDDWVKVMKDITSKYASAFTLAGIPGPQRSVVIQYAPYYKAVTERKASTDYAASLGVGLSSNFLSPDWTQSYRSDFSGSFDPINTWWRNVPVAFESYSMDLCSPVLTYYALASGLDKHVDYLRVDPTLLRDSSGNPTANVPLYQWAGQYIGKSVQNTPRVFTVMYEHRNPTRVNCRSGGLYYLRPSAGSTWPQYGNYNFWLRQVDGIPGGKTVPETNDKGADSRYARDPSTGELWPEAGLGNCPAKSYREDLFGPNYPCNAQPYNSQLPALAGQNLNDYRQYYDPNPWTGEGKEAYVVRRTDQNPDPAKDNPFMFFMVDNGYFDGSQVRRANITVKYFDIGTDQWSLKYDSSSGERVAGTVTKTGTKQLKTKTFTVNDAQFANRLTGSTDFYLDSRNPADNSNDGNEWIHMVEVEKLEGAPETPTPTATPTATPTMTATPTATPSATATLNRTYLPLVLR